MTQASHAEAARRERVPDHEIERMLYERWSPRAMSGEQLSQDQLMRLFEAARWAPSSFNRQPWHFLYALRETEHWPTFLDLLTASNQSWAKDAAALILILSRTQTDDGAPIPTHSFDTGAAWQNLALQGASMGLVIHGIAGFDHARARSALEVPDDHHVEAMIAVGRPGEVEQLPEKYQQRERPRSRKPTDQIATAGPFA